MWIYQIFFMCYDLFTWRYLILANTRDILNETINWLLLLDVITIQYLDVLGSLVFILVLNICCFLDLMWLSSFIDDTDHICRIIIVIDNNLNSIWLLYSLNAFLFCDYLFKIFKFINLLNWSFTTSIFVNINLKFNLRCRIPILYLFLLIYVLIWSSIILL